MTEPARFPELWSRNARGEVVACPCLAFTVYLDETDRDHVLAFYERALGALRPHLTHYLAEHMRMPAKITDRALGMLPTWLKRPKEAHDYQIRFWGGGVLDVSPFSLEIVYTDIPPDPARRARAAKAVERLEKSAHDGYAEIPGSVLRVSVPVDSELADPAVFIPWVLGFDVIREGRFILAESGYSMTTRGEVYDAGFMRDACARYPGLDWFDAHHVRFLRRYEPSDESMLFQVKRAAWLTFLDEGAVRALGGEAKLREQFAGEPAIVLHQVAHGLGIQAGAAPELGDLSRLELPPLQRQVARVIRPVRLRGVSLAFQEEFVDLWFNMLDTEHGAAS